MKNFRDVLREELKNAEFKKEWDTVEPEFRQIRESLDETTPCEASEGFCEASR